MLRAGGCARVHVVLGARAYLKEHAASVALVECGDVAQPYDIDTEADLAHLE